MDQITITQMAGSDDLVVDLNCSSREQAIQMVRAVLIELTKDIDPVIQPQI